MQTKVTYKRVLQFDAAASIYLIKKGFYVSQSGGYNDIPVKPGHFTDEPDTKFSKAIKSMFKQTAKIIEEYKQKIEDLKDEHCLEDPKTKAIILNNGQRMFSKDGQKKLNQAINELVQESVTINSKVVEGILGLDFQEEEAFAGFVIPELPIEEEEEEPKYKNQE